MNSIQNKVILRLRSLIRKRRVLSGVPDRWSLCAVLRLCVLGWVPLLLLGCSDLQAPTVRDVAEHPFGAAFPFDRGTPKAKVLEFWGKPDQVISRGADELGNSREEWIYVGRFPGVPVDYHYVSRTKHLFFDGETLVRWKTESPAQVSAGNAQ